MMDNTGPITADEQQAVLQFRARPAADREKVLVSCDEFIVGAQRAKALRLVGHAAQLMSGAFPQGCCLRFEVSGGYADPDTIRLVGLDGKNGPAIDLWPDFAVADPALRRCEELLGAASTLGIRFPAGRDAGCRLCLSDPLDGLTFVPGR